MNRIELTKKYWNYYLSIEYQFDDTMQYVTVDPLRTYKTYSNRYASLLQIIGGELDSVFKEYCGLSQDSRTTIVNYATSIRASNPEVATQEIELIGTGVMLKPFDRWRQTNRPPSWWVAYNRIKHSRVDHPELGNLENVLNALSALFLMEMMCLKKVTKDTNEIDVFDIPSRLFLLKGWTYNAIPLWSAYAVLDKKGDVSGLTFE